MKQSDGSERLTRSDALAAAILIATVWLLYGKVLRLWWTYDDVFYIHFLLTHSPFSYLFSPRVWQAMPARLLVPLEFLSYQFDLFAFGLRPRLFYAHQLTSLAGATVAVFVLLRLWFSRALALFASLLFVAGVPLTTWASQLMVRNYLEGLLLAGLSARCFVIAVRQGRPSLSVTSAFLYLGAALAKEVYVPLPLLLLALREGDWRSRLRHALPHGLALGAYVTYRYILLGTLLEGYGWAVRPREWFGLVLSLPSKIARTFWGPLALAGAVMGICLAIALAVLLLQRRNSLGVLALSILLVLTPIVPVSKATDPRYGVLAWLLLAVAFGFGYRELPGGYAAFLLAAVLALATLIANRQEWQRRMEEAERMSEEGRSFLSMPSGDLLRHPRIPAAAMNETRWLKEEFLGRPKGSGWFADDIYLCRTRPEGRIWEYREPAKAVRDMTAQARDAAARYCASLQRAAPLSARFESFGGSLFWSLGPYETGKYSLVLDRGVQSFPVAREDGYRIEPPLLTLMVRYESPEGWVTFSPELTMNFRAARRFVWSRPDREESPRVSLEN